MTTLLDCKPYFWRQKHGKEKRTCGRGSRKLQRCRPQCDYWFFDQSKHEQVPCICWRILHILLEVETLQREKQELQKQMQEAAHKQAESRLELCVADSDLVSGG